MEKYQNLSGRSGVTSYEIGENSIIVVFEGDEKYVYNEIRPGKAKVDQMKALAIKGLGLGTYINQHVRKDFYQKMK